MLAVQRIGNVWAVVRLNSAQEIVGVIRTFMRQAEAHECLMALYAKGMT